MEYNKRRFQKANDKKVLHKVKKHWVVMSMALLMAIGGEAVATHVSAHADTANNNNGSANNSTDTIKEQLNEQLVQGQKQASSARNNNNGNGQQSNPQASQTINTKQIGQQASALHQQIMTNAVANGRVHNNMLGRQEQAQPQSHRSLLSSSSVGQTASTYKGMNYKYNPADNSIEFTSGTANPSSTDNLSNLNNAHRVTFDNSVDLSNLSQSAPMSSLLPSDEDGNLQTIAIASDVKMPSKGITLPKGSWINVASDNPQAMTTISQPGIWTRNAEVLNYMDGNKNVGNEILMSPMGTQVTLNVSDDPTNLPNNYQISSKTTFTVNGGSTDVPVKLASTSYTVDVHVVYENNHSDTSDTVPVTLTGDGHDNVYFSPADVAAPDGYELDPNSKNNPTTPYVFDPNTNKWQTSNNQNPTVHFQGKSAGDQSVLVHRVIISSDGATLKIASDKTVSVSSDGKTAGSKVPKLNVGDQYAINPSDATIKLSGSDLSTTASDANNGKGEVLAKGTKYYLSNPETTFYYVDKSNKDYKTLTFHFIDQSKQPDGQVVKVLLGDSDNYTNTGSVGATVNLTQAIVPQGYTLSPGDQTSYKIGSNNEDIDVPVTGDQKTVNVEYTYNNNPLASDTVDNVNVGDVITVPSSKIPKGYQLAPTDSTLYKVSNGNGSKIVTLQMPIEMVPKIVPIEFDNSQHVAVGRIDMKGTVNSGVTLNNNSIPEGYTVPSDGIPLKASDINHSNNSDSFNVIHVSVTGNDAKVPVRYVDSTGKILSTVDVNGQMGNTITSLAGKNNSNVPAGYQLNQNESTSYTFTSNNIANNDSSNDSDQMKPVDLYVSPKSEHYTVLINLHEAGNPNPVQISYPVTGTNNTSDTLKPSDSKIVPSGYTANASDKPVTVQITNGGLVDKATGKAPDINWNYSLKPATKGQVTFVYIDSATQQQVGKSDVVTGNVNTQVMPSDGSMPSDYALNSDVKTNYTVTDKPQTFNLLVHNTGNTQKHYYKLTVQVVSPNGSPIQVKSDNSNNMKTLYTETIDVPVTVDPNEHQDINMLDYYPNNDKKDYSFDFAGSAGNNGIISAYYKASDSNQQIGSGTFEFYAKNKASDSDVKGLTVQYINQNGTLVKSDTTTFNDNGIYEGEPVDLTTLGAPDGYTLMPGQLMKYTIGNQAQTVKLSVEGKPVNALAPVQLMHTSAFFPDQNKILKGVPETVYLPVQGQVGDQIHIDANDFAGYVPNGYQIAGVGNTYNSKTDYATHPYTITLTPSDSNPDSKHKGRTNFYSDSWTGHGTAYNVDPSTGDAFWYSDDQGGRPLLVLQAQSFVSDSDVNHKGQTKPITMYFNIFDTHNRIINTVKISKGDAEYKPLGSSVFIKDVPLSKELAIKYPAYNDEIDTSINSPYMNFIPHGYEYLTGAAGGNPQSVYFGQNSDVSIHVSGKVENVHVDYEYKDSKGSDKKVGSDLTSYKYKASDGQESDIRVGDTIVLPRFNVPNGYYVSDSQPTHYLVKYTDDPADPDNHPGKGPDNYSGIGTINLTIMVNPAVEKLPVKFVDQNNNQVGNTIYIKGSTGQSVKLSSDTKDIQVPAGYMLNAPDKQSYSDDYQFTSAKVDPNNVEFMDPLTFHVTGDPVTVTINFKDGNDETVASYPANTTDDFKVGDVVNTPGTTRDAQFTYGLSNNFNLADVAHHLTLTPSDANKKISDDVKVVGVQHNATDLNINVAYEHDNTTTLDSNVLVTITGHYGSDVAFNPANLALPAGYTLDTAKNKATNGNQSDYEVQILPNGTAKWAKLPVGQTQPTIYLKGVPNVSKSVLVNQVVESAKGVITKIVPTNVTVNGTVGDTYTVSDKDVPKGTGLPSDVHLATGTEPNSSQNKSLTGKILENDIDGQKNIYLSQPTDTLYYVDPSVKSTVTVRYIDQNGHEVHFTNSKGKEVSDKVLSDQPAGAAVNMAEVDSVPSGYTKANSSDNPTSDTYGIVNKDLNIHVTADPANVKAEYYDYDPSTQRYDTDFGSAGSDQGYVGDTINITPQNLTTGYHVVSDVTYRLTPSDDVKAAQPNTTPVHIDIAPNDMQLPINFSYAGQIIGHTMAYGSRDDADYIIDNSNKSISSNLPTGYTFANPQKYNFKTATPVADNAMPAYTVYLAPILATPINLQFRVQGTDYNIESDMVGNNVTLAGSKLDAMDYMPNGYHLADPSKLTDMIYTFNNKPANDPENTKMIYVQPDIEYGQTIPVTLVFKSSDGKTELFSDVENVPVDAASTNGTFDIKPSDFNTTLNGNNYTGRLAQYLKNTRSVKYLANSNAGQQSDIKGDLTHNKAVNQYNPSVSINYTSNLPKTFVYTAKPETMSIQFINQAGNEVGTASASGYYSQQVAGSQLGINVPKGYTLMHPTTEYQFTNDHGQKPTIVMLQGNPVNTTVNSKTKLPANDVQVKIVRYDPLTDKDHPYGHEQGSDIVNVPVDGYVGDSYEIDADQLIPKGGYRIGSNSPTSLTGTIDSDGNITNKTVTFSYQSTAKTTGLFPLRIYYVTSDSGSIGKPLVVYPKNGQNYAGQVPSNLSQMISDHVPGTSGNPLSGVTAKNSQGKGIYYIESGQAISVGFNSDNITNVYLKIKPNPGDVFTSHVILIQNFYDENGNLINVHKQNVEESGPLNSKCYIRPNNYSVDGFTIQNARQFQLLVKSRGMAPDTVTYNYKAQSSSDKNSPVQPVYIAFKDVDNGKPVGTTQRIDGSMDQMMDVLSQAVVPSDYHILPDAEQKHSPFVTFGLTKGLTSQTNPIVFYVKTDQTKMGKVTIRYYNASDKSLVNQVTVEDPLGSDVDLSPYLNSVPENYQLVKSLSDKNPDDNIMYSYPLIAETSKDATASDSNVNVYVRRVVTDNIVYEDVDNDQDPTNNPSVGLRPGLKRKTLDKRMKLLGSQELTGLKGSQIDYSKYTNYLPQGYVFAGFGAKHDTLTGGTDYIYVKKAPAQEFSKITVNYVKHNSDGQVTGSDAVTYVGHIGRTVNLKDFEDQAPAGYVYEDIRSKSPISTYTGYNQMITIDVQPQPSQYGKVWIHFVTGDDNHEVMPPVLSTGYDGKSFDAKSFEHEHPDNYHYIGVIGTIPGTYDAGHDQNLVIKVQ